MSGAERRTFESAGASGRVLDELVSYDRSRFVHAPGAPPLALPLADEPHVEAWREYERRAADEGPEAVLRCVLVQLAFPVVEGMSATEDYRAATRRGIRPGPFAWGAGEAWRDPGSVAIRIHPGPAGAIPVIEAGDRRDFETLVQALTRRNEPWPVPPSMGACMVTGLVNWDRVARHQAAFLAERPDGDWDARLQELAKRPELVRDRFILLSTGPYSGVAAADMGLDDEDWLSHSLRLRAEHEATHYFTQRVFGSMRNNALDEVIADYMGLVAAFGRYRADAALRFLGLEDPDSYREGGRLQNYLDPPLSAAAFTVLCRVVRRAVATLQAFDDGLDAAAREADGRGRTLMSLTAQSLASMAGEGGLDRLLSSLPPRGGSLDRPPCLPASARRA
ncbi:MAG: DUF7005 family protein [Longimicrobiales bacterium]